MDVIGGERKSRRGTGGEGGSVVPTLIEVEDGATVEIGTDGLPTTLDELDTSDGH